VSIVTEYIDQHADRFIHELFGLIRIPSISSDSEHREDMVRAAEYCRNKLREAGAANCEILPATGNPVVYGDKIIDPSLPTILVYGHYDVMPVDPVELWESPPFMPEVRNGMIYARGADDDKGQTFLQMKAFELMVRTGTLPCNVKFMIEGEEETGSPNLPSFCRENKDRLKSDIILVSDTHMISMECPSITIGLRGITFMEIEVTGPNRDLHSGRFGGAVSNPANALARIIASMTDENGKITIPGFYQDVAEISQEEREELAKEPYDEAEFKSAIGVDALYGERGFSAKERTGIRPSLDVNGIWSGYIGEGSKTVLPSKAFAKISMRLVPEQDPDKIARLFESYVMSIAPPWIKVKVKYLHGGKAYVSPIDTIGYRAASKAILESFGKKPVPVRSGGSIPIISEFEAILGVKSILMGFGLASDDAHSPNEHFPLENFFKGIETVPLFYKYFTEMMRKNF
jgi:acetylornithine deacetylase/succinyl-diaminopimelate desuccinylase-like protein